MNLIMRWIDFIGRWAGHWAEGMRLTGDVIVRWMRPVSHPIGRWFEGLPHFFRRLPVAFNFAWFKVYHWFIETFSKHTAWVHEAVQRFVHFGWDFMLFVTVCTFILVISRLVPRRTR